MADLVPARILLVDDDPILRQTLETGLGAAGYIVDSVADAATALHRYRANPPELAVLDIGLPDTPGTELAVQLLAHRYRPILILSGHSDNERVRDAIASGVVGYLVKPLSAQQLVPSIETALARFGDINSHFSRRLGQSALSNAQVEAVIDQFNFGLIIVGEGHRVIHQNAAARQLLDNEKFLVTRGGCLRSLHHVTEFKAMLDRALGASSNGEVPNVLAMRDHADASVAVWTAPLRDGDAAPEHAATVVVVVDPEQATVAPARVLRTLYGLTTKESDLVEALLNGKTLEEYCETTHVSLNTARTHLKSVYRKTDTNRQAELVRLLARLFGNISPDLEDVPGQPH